MSVIYRLGTEEFSAPVRAISDCWSPCRLLRLLHLTQRLCHRQGDRRPEIQVLIRHLAVEAIPPAKSTRRQMLIARPLGQRWQTHEGEWPCRFAIPNEGCRLRYLVQQRCGHFQRPLCEKSHRLRRQRCPRQKLGRYCQARFRARSRRLVPISGRETPLQKSDNVSTTPCMRSA